MDSVSILAEEQRKFEAFTSVRQSLGDGYLYKKNPIFKVVRDEVISLGVRFTAGQRLKDYLVCPHLEYRTISKLRVIPFIKNVAPLLVMEQLLPDLSFNKMLEIKKNKILHESAHLVADFYLAKGKVKPHSLEDQRNFVFLSLASESFASACETIGQIFISNSIHQWMYRQNTNLFGCELQDYQNLLKVISSKFGLRFSFGIAFFSFLRWNYFLPEMDKKDLELVVSFLQPFAAMSSSERSLILDFSRSHFRVRERFRKEIAEVYFLSQGIKTPFKELIELEVSLELKSRRSWTNRIEKLLKIIPEMHFQ